MDDRSTRRIAVHDSTQDLSKMLFQAKSREGLTFAEIAEKLKRDEVAIAAIFYGQGTLANDEEISALEKVLRLDDRRPYQPLKSYFYGFPNRGQSVPMPPTEPLIYRLYEIVQNYGYAYKAIMNEKFGDGIMSAIAFSTKVEKEVDDDGVAWVNLKMRGKWLPYTKF